MKNKIHIWLCGFFLLFLMGCDGSSSEDSAQGKFSEEKWSAYVKVYNDWDGLFDKPPVYLQAVARDLEAAQAGDFSKIRESRFIKADLQNLKDALAKKGSMQPFDQYAEQMIQLIELHLPAWKNLEAYNLSRGYDADNGTKGKALLESYLKLQEELPPLYQKFARALEAEAKVQKNNEIERLKSSGETFLYQMNWAIYNAEEVVNLFAGVSEAEFNNPALFQKADEYIAIMEAQMEPINAEITKNSKMQKFNGSYSTSLHFIGKYREFKNEPSLKTYQSLTLSYNSIIGQYNRAAQY